MPGLYRLELQVTKGTGKLATSGLWNSSAAKEQVKIAFDFFKANAARISGGNKVNDHDFHLHAVELQNTGPFTHLALASLVVFSSGLLGKPVQSLRLWGLIDGALVKIDGLGGAVAFAS